VYKIRHRKTNQFRAVKIIKKSSILSKIEEEELDREIQILKSLVNIDINKLEPPKYNQIIRVLQRRSF
jgi:hypothetical protein